LTLQRFRSITKSRDPSHDMYDGGETRSDDEIPGQLRE
jgi:hypothetical protein